jgi:transposase
VKIISLVAFVKREMEAIRSEMIMNKRYELTDEQWQAVEPILPRRTATTGRKPKEPRQMLNGIVWVLRSGAPWRDVPERYGRWKTVYDYYRNWRDNGTFDRILSALQIRLDREGPQITLWAARVADGAASSTWLLTAEACPWRSKSRPANATNRRKSNR